MSGYQMLVHSGFSTDSHERHGRGGEAFREGYYSIRKVFLRSQIIKVKINITRDTFDIIFADSNVILDD